MDRVIYFTFISFLFLIILLCISLAMNPVPFQAVPPQWFPMLPPNPPMSSAFWESKNVQDRLRELQDTLNLAKAMYVPD